MFERRRLQKRLDAARAASDALDRWVLYIRAGNSEAEVRDAYMDGPCERCVTAARPDGPAVLLPSAQRAVKKAQPVLLLGSHEVLLHIDLLAALGDEGTTGLHLRRVLLPDGAATAYMHAVPQAVAPPLAATTVGVTMEVAPPPCPRCSRDQRYDERVSERVYVLAPGKLDPASWLATWEHFGRSRTWEQAEGNVATPRFIVSGAVRGQLAAAGARVDFVPVRQQREPA